MTVQQELFYYGSRVRKYYENVQKDRELTPREKHHLDEVNKNLWSSIVRFAMQTAHSMMYKCNLSNDAFLGFSVMRTFRCVCRCGWKLPEILMPYQKA